MEVKIFKREFPKSFEKLTALSYTFIYSNL